MDWYSWLSKTNLDPYLVYEYGRLFTHNELQTDDTNHFTHEFLQSIGVSVAKHRLQILNLARNNIGDHCPKNKFSKILYAISKTRMLVSKKLGTWVSFKHAVRTPMPEADPNVLRPQWPGVNLRRNMGFEEIKEEKVKRKKKMKSGPLDRRVHEGYMNPKIVSSVSGPLDRKVQENMMVMYKSPRMGSEPLDVPGIGLQTGGGEDDALSSVWSLMFQNIKPT
ncbi:hypothetical protein QVD17_03222 [Tagetes erecta]|uniref:SAM domain-containing protein n=1 Tax=Tagetes erecta TaxID=13708 RepID=A0AAD8P9U0_TARER|nr:hypothetical protein QVD17_03222 [Tagetes erecta]